MATLDEYNKQPDDWDTLFPKSINNPNSNQGQDKIFEIGLVLGGTVSAGAYTAGVLDFLIEALDAFQQQKINQPNTTPDWTVKIKVVTGTSGGGVNAAIMARVLSWQFPAIRTHSSEDDQKKNPFYSIWVDGLDIKDMLKTDDIETKKPPYSLLNPKPLDNGALKIANFKSNFPTLTPKKDRDYVENPLPVFLTLTNLRGIPCKIDMGNGMYQEYTTHADYVRISFFTQGFNSTYILRPDEFGVCDGQSGDPYKSWGDVAQFVLGTSAFPLGFPERQLTRPLAHYRYRPVVIPGDDNAISTEVKPLSVKWEAFLAPNQFQNLITDYTFPVADGGIMDNEPITLCRQALSGYTARNPRAGNKAFRAVVLIDPFADKAELGKQTKNDLISSIGPLVNALKNQARFETRDLLLAGDDTVFSRFMITANGNHRSRIGGKAIACASAKAFGGFLHKSFRRHDYFLGRQNCQEFLRDKFCLDVNNPIVNGWYTINPNSPFIKNGLVPLIPLYGECKDDEDTESYPVNQFEFNEEFTNAVKNRIDKVVDVLEDTNLNLEWYQDLYMSIPFDKLKEKLFETTINWFDASLKNWELKN